MNVNWRKKVRRRYGKVLQGLNEFPHPQSPAALALMAHTYSELEHENDNYWTWLRFRDEFFKELGPAGTVCFYCHKHGLDHDADQDSDNLATLDHVKPLADGGGLYDKNNLVVACKYCNQKKGKKSVEVFIVELNN